MTCPWWRKGSLTPSSRPSWTLWILTGEHQGRSRSGSAPASCRTLPTHYTFPPRPRDGHVSLQEYMAFMISRETENVKSSEEIESAFRALSSEGKPYVTKEELYQVWSSASWAGGRACPLKGKSPGKAGPEVGGITESGVAAPSSLSCRVQALLPCFQVKLSPGHKAISGRDTEARAQMFLKLVHRPPPQHSWCGWWGLR